MVRYPPYNAADVAQMLGHSVDWFYRHAVDLYEIGMPRPLCPFGRKKFDRRAIDAWISRHYPAPGLEREPANDLHSLSIEEQREVLAREYGRH
jgi:predicted DNA-binding transcriptional regulator AlpA